MCVPASSRGQESAPFELLIAVIVMIFVMGFGYFAIDKLWKMDCEARIDAELEEMKTAIEACVNQGELERVKFDVPQCFKDSRVRISQLTDGMVCSDICQEGRQSCVSLDFLSDDGPMKRVCVNISINTNFEGPVAGGSGTLCPEKENYGLIPINDSDVGVPNGDYLFVNKTRAGDTPAICAYVRE